MKIDIIPPLTQSDWEAYYHLRWQLLREPWQQPQGSEKDEWESKAIHRMAKVNDKVAGVARLHVCNEKQAQIRYMAVHQDYRRKGIATALLDSLESACPVNDISLNSRESACAFYQAQGYCLGEETHTLFGTIRHFVMSKNLA